MHQAKLAYEGKVLGQDRQELQRTHYETRKQIYKDTYIYTERQDEEAGSTGVAQDTTLSSTTPEASTTIRITTRARYCI